MVSKWWIRPQPPAHVPNWHQSKIYAESNHSNFSRILEDLTSMQTLAIYRRLLVMTARSTATVAISIATRSQRRPESRDVFSASLGVLGRAGARAVAQGQNPGIGQAATIGRVRSRVGRDRRGLGHESVLQAPAGGM